MSCPRVSSILGFLVSALIVVGAATASRAADSARPPLSYAAPGIENWTRVTVSSPNDVRPGDVLMYRAPDVGGLIISACTGLGPYCHVALVVGDGLKAETRLTTGGRVVPVGSLENVDVYRNAAHSERAAQAAADARELAPKFRYNPRGLLDFLPDGLRPLFSGQRRPRAAICSEFVNNLLWAKGIGIVDPSKVRHCLGDPGLVAPNHMGYALGQHTLCGMVGEAAGRGWQAFRGAASLVAGRGFELAAKGAGGIDFSSVDLVYLADFAQEDYRGVGYVLRGTKAAPGENHVDTEVAAQDCLRGLLVWLALPNSAFWVNLNPAEPDRLCDARLSKTDLGRVLLEADLQLKKDLAALTHPKESTVGREFWDALYAIAIGRLSASPSVGAQQIAIPVTYRVWIVPERARVSLSRTEIAVIDARLDVKLESEYLASRGGVVSFSVPSAYGTTQAEVQRAAEAMLKRKVLPRLKHAINHSPQYSELRGAYRSRVVAECYKRSPEFGGKAFASVIGSGEIAALESRKRWSPGEIQADYLRSLKQGEYSLTETSTVQHGLYVVQMTKQYFLGGIDFRAVSLGVERAPMSPGMASAVLRALSTPAGAWDEDYYYWGELFLARST